MITNDRKSNADMVSVMSSIGKETVLDVALFERIVSMELARVIRSSGKMSIVIVNVKSIAAYFTQNNKKHQMAILSKSIKELKCNIRENDSIGWIKNNEKFGVLFTDIGDDTENVLKNKLVEHFKKFLIDEDALLSSITCVNLPKSIHTEDTNDGDSFIKVFKKKNLYTRRV